MLANKFRKIFDKIFSLVVRIIDKLGISPNMLTLLSLILMIPVVYFIYFNDLLYASLFFLIVILMDGLDGLLAKISKKKTKFGEFFDAFSDRIVEGVIYLTIAITFTDLAFLSILALILSYSVSYISARAESWTIGKIKIRYSGVGSRSERVLVLALALFLNQLFYGLIIICLLAGIGTLQRLIIIKKRL